MTRWIALVVAAVCAGAGLAQQPAAPKPPERVLREHDDASSRQLFTACDADGDDRLDLFECCKSMDGLRGEADREGFARLDQDRDGFLSWPEFDAAFRTAVQGGGTFKVRPTRRLQSTGNASRSTPLQQFLQLHDGNHSGGLDSKEIDLLLRQNQVPKGLDQQLRALDLDGSGEVDEAELAPWFELLRGGTRLLGERPGAHRLPAPWQLADANHDDRLDAEELGRLLRALDPALARWSIDLLAALDRDKNGKLDPAELQAATPSPTAGTPLPKQLPLR